MGLLGLLGNVGRYLIPKLTQNTTAGGGHNTTPGGTTVGGNNSAQPVYATNTPAQPVYDTNTPDVERMSWEQAIRQAEAMYKPKYEAGVLARDKMASDQREMLAQTMASRGYANPAGGKWESGTGNITQEQAIDQQNLASSFDASKMQYANALYDTENARADAILSQLIDKQNRENAAKQADWAASQTRAMSKEQNDTDEYNNTMAWLLKLLGLEE